MHTYSVSNIQDPLRATVSIENEKFQCHYVMHKTIVPSKQYLLYKSLKLGTLLI